MEIGTWIAFVAASSVLLAIPGPTVLLVVSYALSHGRRARIATVAGVGLGDFTAMTGSMMGLGALLAASSALFAAFKWAGAAYLVYLGIKMWRTPGSGADGSAGRTEARPSRIFLHAYAVTALNPKGIVFFVAFLPQFVDATQPFLPQFALLEATFLVLAIANASLYAILAQTAGGLARSPRARRTVNRAGGAVLIGAGLLAALWRRTPA